MKINKSLITRLLQLKLNPVPVRKGTKIPLREAHQTAFQSSEIDNYNWSDLEVGISTGFSSLNLEVLDFDLKNTSNPDKFMTEYNQHIPEELLNKLVIQKTPSGGFHYLYRCDEIESNQKLARNRVGEAVIETRGVGGYIKSFPSSGYSIESKVSFSEIPYITVQERRLLFTLARQKDELLFRDNLERYSREDKDYLSKFSEYNSDPQTGIDLLEKHGWSFHSQNGVWYNMTRPGSSSGDLHGGYNQDNCFFQVWSTAQDVFQPRRGYNNHHIFAELECKGNYPQAYAKLYELYPEYKDVSLVDDSSLSFLSTYESENEYLDQARRGDIPLGNQLGWVSLDPYYRLKKNSFDYWLGVENIGKSTLISSIMVASKVLYGDKWGISSPEALAEATRKNLIEAQAGKEIKGMTSEEYQSYLKDSRENFLIIETKEYYSVDQILEYGKVLYQKYGITYFVIDPYSFYAGSGNYALDLEMLSKIRVFCQNYCSVIVVDHTNTEFTRDRKNYDKSGYLMMPSKYDAAGGNIKVNKCDNFLCFHRIINHQDDQIERTMQISVQKIKDKSTGGKPHRLDEWSELEWDTRDGFTGYWDSDGNNPMYTAKMSKMGLKQKEVLKPVDPMDAFI